jgi:2-oxoglutarate ferredoxin oxidoreductase subunit delta
MAKIEINEERCKGCGLCTLCCPKKLIQIGKEINRQGYFYASWDEQEACTGCALCGEICPDIAITIWK